MIARRGEVQIKLCGADKNRPVRHETVAQRGVGTGIDGALVSRRAVVAKRVIRSGHQRQSSRQSVINVGRHNFQIIPVMETRGGVRLHAQVGIGGPIKGGGAGRVKWINALPLGLAVGRVWRENGLEDAFAAAADVVITTYNIRVGGGQIVPSSLRMMSSLFVAVNLVGGFHAGRA